MRECCKGDDESQWERGKFDPRHPKTPQPMVTKICVGDYVGDIYHRVKFLSKSVQGVRFCTCVISRPSAHSDSATFFFGVFYRAMLCIRGTSHGPVSVCLSVCLSVTSRSSTKTAKRRITQITPHDTTKTLVFWCQRSPRNSTGVTPYEGAECRWGGSKSATLDQ